MRGPGKTASFKAGNPPDRRLATTRNDLKPKRQVAATQPERHPTPLDGGAHPERKHLHASPIGHSSLRLRSRQC